MRYIKEPADITLTVVNKGLSEDEKQIISEFIKKDKARKNIQSTKKSLLGK